MKIQHLIRATFTACALLLSGLANANVCTPLNVSAVGGDGVAIFSFDPPVCDGGSPIINYEYRADFNGAWIALSPADNTSPVTIPGLTNGMFYTIQIRAVTALEASVGSAWITVGPRAQVFPATAPTGLTATAGDGQATISFTAPSSDGGSAISNYAYSLDGGTTWIVLNPADGSSPVTVGGLTNGTAYNIQLRAVNAAGGGEVSASVTVTPEAPAVDELIIGPASFSDGTTGVPYSQNISPTGGVGHYICSNPEGPLPDGIQLLDNILAGTPTRAATDNFIIACQDSLGTIALKNYSITINPGNVLVLLPATMPSGTVGSAYATVEITRERGDYGDGPYTYRVTRGSLPPGLALIDADLTESGYPEISGTPTTAGTYTFTLYVEDSNGDYGSRDYTIEVTGSALNPATAPTGLTATAGNGQATISFTVPSDNGGSAISNYEYSLDGGSTWIALSPTDDTSPVTVGGLTNGTAYNIQLRAVTDAGAGAASASVSVTPVAPVIPATQPTGLTATAGDGQATISFTAPSDNGGSAISNYEYSLDGGSTWIALSPADGTSPVTVGGLTNGTAYNIQLRPVTSAGAGAASASVSVTPVGAASAPTGLTATAGNGQATISFTAPSNNGGSAITGYRVTAYPGGITATGTSSPITVTGLTNGVSYTFTVVAITAAGDGQASASIQLLVNVRTDPSRDPGVIASVQTQVDASSRFALTQQMNIRDRLRQVRAGSNGNNNGISLNLAGGTGPGLNLNAAEVADAAVTALPEDWGWWTAGAVQFGDRKQGSGSEGFDFRSDGLTFGVDRQVGDHGVIGATFGRGWSDTEFDRSDSSLAADQKSLSIYGMYNGERWYIDGLVGYGDLDFEIHRYVSSLDDHAVGMRSGSQLFGSLTMGYQHIRNTDRFVGYARLDASHTRLDAYHESGAGIYDLSYAEQTIDSSTVSFGLESGHQWMTAAGMVRPYWMFEYRMALDDRSDAGINYATLPASGNYILQMRDYATGAIVWGAGLDMDINERWGLSLLYRGERLQGDAEGDSYAVGLKLTYRGAAPANPVEASSENGMAQMDKADIPD